MAYDVDLMEGVAEALAEAGYGIWRPDGAYTAGEHAIVLDTVPSEPDAVTVLSAYTLTDNPTEASNLTGLQVRTRAPGQDPRAAREMADDVHRLLHGRWAWTLPNGLHIVQINRRSHVSGGRDDNRRTSILQNFHADLFVPALLEETP